MRRFLLAVAALLAVTATPALAGYLVIRVILEGGGGTPLVLLHEPVGRSFLAAAGLMGAGVWLHLTERHQHEHRHERLTHSHRHVHDEHHQHEHPAGVDPNEPHTHEHTHEPLTHSHPHFPDIHHRHGHA